ncbi:glutamine--fructose-6-phosphate transaminase (isomerizing) [bacterium]|nr:glutamine--fructose-6-phosphate transaminase (isomerizing) [bacterium]
MCGIVGYIGKKKAPRLLIEGLKRLEYRGYDSAGISVINKDKIETVKAVGKIHNLEKRLNSINTESSIGIAHTRWATHGEPNETNAHPHMDNDNLVAVAHNGIIENYHILQQELKKEGAEFKSATDSEVLAHLIASYIKKDFPLDEAVRRTMERIEGTYGMVVLCRKYPDKLVAARNGSPLIVGIGENEFIVASDASAIVEHTRQIIYLHDRELIMLNKDEYSIKTIQDIHVQTTIEDIDWDIEMIEKGGFDHFMLKEIFEQPEALHNAMRGRLDEKEMTTHLGGLSSVKDRLRQTKRIIITACGTSWHSALIAEYMFEELAQIPTEVEYASEFRYRNPIITEEDTVICISQSGETADTLAALREAKRKGALTLGICNTVGGTISRETDAGVYLHAGPEIGVASTKAFTCQLMVLSLIALKLARMRNMSHIQGDKIITALKKIPFQVKEIFESDKIIQELAQRFTYAQNFLYLGRGYNFPVALEGALKLKEISYIHAEGYPAAEMKHGPIALISENMPVVVIATKNSIYEKVVSNIEEVKARKGYVIAIATDGDKTIAKKADKVIYIPETLSFLVPILSVIPLQMLSYYIAVLKGRNVDQPRNLAKSVTVE